MTGAEIVKLIQWLTEHGFTDSQIIECINFVESKNP